MIRFGVSGKARPQGSFIARVINGRAFAVPSNDNQLRQWRNRVRAAAVVVAERSQPSPVYGPDEAVVVSLVFALDRPASVPVRKRLFPTVKPDIDKLTRAVLDALAGVAYHDDAQVCRLWVDKNYADDVEPGVIVTVYRRHQYPREGNPTNGEESIGAQA